MDKPAERAPSMGRAGDEVGVSDDVGALYCQSQRDDKEEQNQSNAQEESKYDDEDAAHDFLLSRLAGYGRILLPTTLGVSHRRTYRVCDREIGQVLLRPAS